VENLPWWAAEFGKLARRIWKNLPRKTVVPIPWTPVVSKGSAGLPVLSRAVFSTFSVKRNPLQQFWLLREPMGSVSNQNCCKNTALLSALSTMSNWCYLNRHIHSLIHSFTENKKTELSQRCPRNAPNTSCPGGAVVGRQTRDWKVAGSTPSRGAIKSTRSTQPSITPGYVNRVPACMAGVKQAAFTCAGWQVTLCDPTWQVTSRSSEMGFPRRAISAFNFFSTLGKKQSTHYMLLTHIQA